MPTTNPSGVAIRQPAASTWSGFPGGFSGPFAKIAAEATSANVAAIPTRLMDRPNPAIGFRQGRPDLSQRFAVSDPVELERETAVQTRAFVRLHFIAAILCNDQGMYEQRVAADVGPHVRISAHGVERFSTAEQVGLHRRLVDVLARRGEELYRVGLRLDAAVASHRGRVPMNAKAVVDFLDVDAEVTALFRPVIPREDRGAFVGADERIDLRRQRGGRNQQQGQPH